MSGADGRASPGVNTDPDAIEKKIASLQGLLRELGPVLVAFSGGVDSSVLLQAAFDVLGRDGVVAATANGDVHTDGELVEAREAAVRMGVKHVVVRTNELALPGFAENPPDRCYVCKHALYMKLGELAWNYGMKTVVDGANGDDDHDFRPGIKAARALGVRSPLAECGIGKDEVRVMARQWGLPEWDRPSSPCLASRFPYGEAITLAGLAMVAEGESYLRGLGVQTVRLRHHGSLARIEVEADDIPLLTGFATQSSEEHSAGRGQSVRRDIVEHLRGLGYKHVTLDLEGFRSGSLNDGLEPESAQEEEG